MKRIILAIVLAAFAGQASVVTCADQAKEKKLSGAAPLPPLPIIKPLPPGFPDQMVSPLLAVGNSSGP